MRQCNKHECLGTHTTMCIHRNLQNLKYICLDRKSKHLPTKLAERIRIDHFESSPAEIRSSDPRMRDPQIASTRFSGKLVTQHNRRFVVHTAHYNLHFAAAR